MMNISNIYYTSTYVITINYKTFAFLFHPVTFFCCYFLKLLYLMIPSVPVEQLVWDRVFVVAIFWGLDCFLFECCYVVLCLQPQTPYESIFLGATVFVPDLDDQFHKNNRLKIVFVVGGGFIVIPTNNPYQLRLSLY